MSEDRRTVIGSSISFVKQTPKFLQKLKKGGPTVDSKFEKVLGPDGDEPYREDEQPIIEADEELVNQLKQQTSTDEKFNNENKLNETPNIEKPKVEEPEEDSNSHVFRKTKKKDSLNQFSTKKHAREEDEHDSKETEKESKKKKEKNSSTSKLSFNFDEDQ